MSIVVEKDLKDIYIDMISDYFIKSVFYRSQILRRDMKSINIEAKYDKKYLRDYENIMNILDNFCNINDITLNVEKQIIPYQDRFFISYIVNIKNHQDFPIFPFLNLIRCILIIEFKSINTNEVLISIAHTEVHNNIFDNSNDIIKDYIASHLTKQDDTGVYNVIAVSGPKTDMLNQIKILKEVYTNDIQYDITKDLLMNFLNILVNNRIKYEYMKKICKFYIEKCNDISIRLI